METQLALAMVYLLYGAFAITIAGLIMCALIFRPGRRRFASWVAFLCLAPLGVLYAPYPMRSWIDSGPFAAVLGGFALAILAGPALALNALVAPRRSSELQSHSFEAAG
jgi:hypothetical protein